MSFEERFKEAKKSDEERRKREREFYSSQKRKYINWLSKWTDYILEICEDLAKVKNWKCFEEKKVINSGYRVAHKPLDSFPENVIKVGYFEPWPRFIANSFDVDNDNRIKVVVGPKTWEPLVLRMYVKWLVYDPNVRSNWDLSDECKPVSIFVDESSEVSVFQDEFANVLEIFAGLETQQTYLRDHYYISGEEVISKPTLTGLKREWEK